MAINPFLGTSDVVNQTKRQAFNSLKSKYGQWDRNGGNLTREQIYEQMIGEGIRPEIASRYVYTFLKDQAEPGTGGPPTVLSASTGGSSGGGGSSIDLNKLAEDYNRQKAQAEADLTSAGLEFEAKGRQIGTARESALTGGNEALAQNTAYFNQISPDAYQSQLENYNTKVATGYQKAKEDLDFQEGQLGEKRKLYDEAYQRSVAQMESDYASAKAGGSGGGGYSSTGTGAEEIDPVTIMNTLSGFYAQAKAGFGPAVAQTLTQKAAKKFNMDANAEAYYTNPSNLENWLNNLK